MCANRLPSPPPIVALWSQRRLCERKEGGGGGGEEKEEEEKEEEWKGGKKGGGRLLDIDMAIESVTNITNHTIVTFVGQLVSRGCGEKTVVKILFWKQGSIEYKVKKGFVSDQEICEVKIRCLLASFPAPVFDRL